MQYIQKGSDVTVKEGVTKLPNFIGRTDITRLDLPGSITELPDSSFCIQNLEEVIIRGKIKKVGKNLTYQTKLVQVYQNLASKEFVKDRYIQLNYIQFL